MITYAKREIAHLLGVSPKTIAEYAKHLNLKPIEGDRGLKLYSESDFNLISQMREHCADKSNSRESFVPNTEVEVVEDVPQVSKLTANKNSNSAINIYQQSLAYGMEQDPLFDLELLQRISDNQWLLPASRLAPLFGISPQYLNSLTQYYYCGFIANKEAYAGGRALWKISSNNN
ncbi:MAG: MerR family transcriptional regulator [Pleurocapsa sp. MO_226.B13]|nr:MerR family transcriptional regulator [Pleurocapsa sp. MO_226.B13]